MTNPLNGDIDDDLLRQTADAINQKSDGPQIALRFLAHKIQSPQEIEAMHSLNVSDGHCPVLCCNHVSLRDALFLFRSWKN